MNKEPALVPGNAFVIGNDKWNIYLSVHCQFCLGVGFHRMTEFTPCVASIVIWLGPFCLNFEHTGKE